MKLSLLALPLIAVAAPALAEPSCKTPAAPVPMWSVAKSFEDSGGRISNMKVNDGCYEIYGKAGDKRVELFFDPASGSQIGAE